MPQVQRAEAEGRRPHPRRRYGTPSPPTYRPRRRAGARASRKRAVAQQASRVAPAGTSRPPPPPMALGGAPQTPASESRARSHGPARARPALRARAGHAPVVGTAPPGLRRLPPPPPPPPPPGRPPSLWIDGAHSRKHTNYRSKPPAS
eukprot:scaffold9760_cov106-Isochrysis_galbana.AAC.3